MTPHEALWLIKTQLQKTPQNIKAVQVLEELVTGIYQVQFYDDHKTYTLDEAIIELGLGNEAEHVKNHMAKVGKADLIAFNTTFGDDE